MALTHSVWVAILLSFLQVSHQQDTNLTRVLTRLGEVVGSTRIGSGGQPVLSIYKGIPYAEPPIGPLRFSKPQPTQPWINDSLDALEYGPDCIPGQFGQSTYRALDGRVHQSEDCLTLNIFVPDEVVATDGPLPVMVWIHGGGFVVGAGSETDGSVLAKVGRVLVVTLNYRLGVFGFLSTGDDASPGNYGLWDQRLAIAWVKDNIDAFGGDPGRLTLFGFSAGGKAVAMQTATPVNDRTLFQRAIMESGSADDSAINSPETAALRSRQIGGLLNCDSSQGSRALIACLREVDPETLVQASNLLDVEFVDFSSFYPTIDGEFFPDYVLNVLAEGYLGQYDFMTGVNSDEGTLAQSSSRIPSSIDSADELSTIMRDLLVSSFCRCENAQEAAEAVAFHYTSERGTSDGRLNRAAVLDAFADVLYTSPCLNNIKYHTEANLTTRGNSYLYFFPYRPEDEPNSEPDIIRGAGHGDEVSYVFGERLRDNPGTEKGNLSALLISYWTNFARNGDPNDGDVPYWPKYNFENESYIILQPDVAIGSRLQASQVSLWLDYLPSIVQPLDTNRCSLDVPIPDEESAAPGLMRTVQIVSADGDVMGTVIGVTRKADQAMGGREVAEFRGIPYAEPPVGKLRFKPPEVALPWLDEPLDLRSAVPPACPQDVTKDPLMTRVGFNTTSEDCLRLNIYAPVRENGEGVFPTVVVIHSSDDLLTGTASVYHGSPLASNSKAVVILANYRLGALGFLSTQDAAAPGNYGLHDILAVLQWVNKFIGSFGGDPSNVTVIGHGAGSMLAHLLVLSDKSRGMFQRVVSMSGTALSPELFNPVQPDPTDLSEAVANKLGCPTDTSALIVDCLRDKPATDLIEATQEPPLTVPFPVVVDGDFFRDHPAEILQSGNFQDVEFIVGVARDEKAATAASFLGDDWTRCPDEAEVESLIDHVSREAFHRADIASLTLAVEYLHNGNHIPDDRDCPMRGYFRRFLQDFLAAVPAVQTALYHASSGGRVFLFVFDHLPTDHYIAKLPPWAGPAFGDDLQSLFGDPYNPMSDQQLLPYRLKDKKTSLELMNLISGFVYEGAPGVSLSGAAWPQFEMTNMTYLSVDPCPQVRSGIDEGWEHKLGFWSDFLATVTEPTPSSPFSTCVTPVDCVVGSIGLEMSPDTASALIGALIGVSVALFVFLLIMVLGYCITSRRSMTSKTAGSQIELDAQQNSGYIGKD